MSLHPYLPITTTSLMLSFLCPQSGRFGDVPLTYQPTYLSTTNHLPTVHSRYCGHPQDHQLVSVITRVLISGV